MADDDGFMSRWSRRKAQARTGVPTEAEASANEASPSATVPTMRTAPVLNDAQAVPDLLEAAPMSDLSPDPSAPDAAPGAIGSAFEGGLPVADEPPALPTLADVARLTPEADFSAFVDRAVTPEVRNAAMKKLFTDPHFNVMDGLDVYIDDYNKADPLPRQWLRQMVQARMLGLLDDELVEQPKPHADTDTLTDTRTGTDTHEAPLAEQAVESAADDATDLASNEADITDAVVTPTDNPAAHEDADLQLQPDDAAGHGGTGPGPDDEPASG